MRPIAVVVDDQRAIADTLTVILAGNGFDATAAYDGESGLELASAIVPDVLITDVVMPGMSGIELAMAVREIIPACKVLLFSGQAATADLLVDARAKGHEFRLLVKPVHPTDLLAHVSSLMETG